MTVAGNVLGQERVALPPGPPQIPQALALNGIWAVDCLHKISKNYFYKQH
jgi:hypothetical protein